MTDIDWQAVNVVVKEHRPQRLRPDEKRMAVRRLSRRMLDNSDCGNYWSPSYAAKITASQVAEWLFTTERSVQRIKDDLPPAVEQRCPECGEPCWVYPNRMIEAHPDRFRVECEASDTQLPAPLQGLAAVRPDLYRWVEVSA